MSGNFDRSMDMRQDRKGAGDFTEEANRSLGNGHASRPQSPLKFFIQAKKRINDVFKEIAEYVQEAEGFLCGNYWPDKFWHF